MTAPLPSQLVEPTPLVITVSARLSNGVTHDLGECELTSGWAHIELASLLRNIASVVEEQGTALVVQRLGIETSGVCCED